MKTTFFQNEDGEFIVFNKATSYTGKRINPKRRTFELFQAVLSNTQDEKQAKFVISKLQEGYVVRTDYTEKHNIDVFKFRDTYSDILIGNDNYGDVLHKSYIDTKTAFDLLESTLAGARPDILELIHTKDVIQCAFVDNVIHTLINNAHIKITDTRCIVLDISFFKSRERTGNPAELLIKP